MKEFEQLSYAVIPDSHGQYDRIAAAAEAIGSSVDKLVFLGDVFDGPDPRKLIQLIREIGSGAITILGNHEWVYRNSLTENEELEDNPWRDQIWRGYEKGTLLSYGITRSKNWRLNASLLREAMTETGDLDWLMDLPPYYETSDFVAIHAGPALTSAWSKQSHYLDSATQETNRQKREPAQIFKHKLAQLNDVPESVDNRIFVSGHTPIRKTAEERVAVRRVCLASKLGLGDPLFVWYSEEDRIYQY